MHLNFDSCQSWDCVRLSDSMFLSLQSSTRTRTCQQRSGRPESVKNSVVNFWEVFKYILSIHLDKSKSQQCYLRTTCVHNLRELIKEYRVLECKDHRILQGQELHQKHNSSVLFLTTLPTQLLICNLTTLPKTRVPHTLTKLPFTTVLQRLVWLLLSVPVVLTVLLSGASETWCALIGVIADDVMIKLMRTWSNQIHAAT